MLDTTVGPWGVRWYRIPLASLMRSGSEQELAQLAEKLGSAPAAAAPEQAAQLSAPARDAAVSGGGLPPLAGPPGASRLLDALLGAAVGIAVGASIALTLVKNKVSLRAM